MVLKDFYYLVSKITRDQPAINHHNESPAFEIELRRRLNLKDFKKQLHRIAARQENIKVRRLIMLHFD